jgi:hypothetical protein
MIKLQETHSESSPTANILIETISKRVINKAGCFRTETYIEPISLLCRGANVQINGIFLETNWGLYNGMGAVIEIVYGEDNTFQGQSTGQGCTIPCIIVQPKKTNGRNKSWITL